MARFALDKVQTDVLKSLYESLIDPVQRHDLGEYYTPDWLAHRMCQRVIDRPLEQRVLDPACGSGTFLFHAVRRFLDAATAASISNRESLIRCTGTVLGIDVHPVAVLIARVTYLLALGEERLRDHPPMTIPVYLGDSLQRNTMVIMDRPHLRIPVPGEEALVFPAAITSDPNVFDDVIQFMLDASEQGTEGSGVRAWLKRTHPVDEKDEDDLVVTYEHLARLKEEGKNHIWGYVARNQSKPVWLAYPLERVDILVGNPPWLSYRYMCRNMQLRFRKECQDRNIWLVATSRPSKTSQPTSLPAASSCTCATAG